MIRFQLVCKCKNQFESWFRSSDDFGLQCAKGLLSCPSCGSKDITKALMSPNVSTSRSKATEVTKTTEATETTESRALNDSPSQKEIREAVRDFRTQITEKSEYVGEKFSAVARKIHYGDEPDRMVHGEASVKDVKELKDEGIGVMPLPELPEDKN